MVEKLMQVGAAPSIQRTAPQKETTAQGSFDAALKQQLEASRSVAFSKHALARVEERGIEVTPNLISRLNDSVGKAQEKGATNILALDRSLAFIINVPNNRVITAMNQDEMKENVFTNIDGAVIL